MNAPRSDRRSGDPRRRQRHAPVAAQPLAASEAVPLARRRRRLATRPCSSRRRGASPTSATPGIAVQPPCIVANEEHRFTVIEQLRAIGIEPARVLLEPFGRNTAPALQLAALEAARSVAAEIDPILVVSPADHAIARARRRSAPPCVPRCARRRAAASSSSAFARSGPTPATATSVPARPRAASGESLPVAAFVEKPDLATAERYLADGGYYWNGGMFICGPASGSKRCAASAPTSRPRATSPSAAPPPMRPSFASTAPPSPRSRPTASTTR